MAALKDVQNLVKKARDSGAKVTRIDLEQAGVDALAKELGLPAGQAMVEVDGVPIYAMSERDTWISKACAYANWRWHIELTPPDAHSLFGKVAVEEMAGLIPPMVDQLADERNAPDPVDDMTEDEVKALKEKLRELDLDGIEV
jgi:hypothetical protein